MKVSRVQIFVVIMCGFLFPAQVNAISDATVLIIHSYHQEYPWTKKENDGFVQTLNNSLPETYINYQTEYLDTKRVSLDQGYQEIFYQYLKYKYSDYSPDLIFASDDNALMFLLKYKNRLFKDVPVVFCGVNNLDIEEKINRREYTGIFEKKEIIPNLNLVSNVIENFGKLLLVGDGSSTDQAIVKSIIDDIQSHLPGIEYQVLTGNDFPALENQLKSVGNGLILLTTIGEMKDRNREVLPLKKTLKAIVQAGDFIVISMEDAYLEYGVLGGYVTSGYAQGKAAASLASRILEGESPASIELVQDSPNDYMFNYPQLKKLAIDSSKLPQQSIILDRPRSLYEEYRYEILSIIVFLVFQTIIIAILIENVSRRKKAELSLQVSKDNLENQVIERTKELSLRNTDLQISEAKHKALVNNIPGMVYTAKPDWSAEIFSGSESLCGFTEKELNTKKTNWLSIIHHDDIGNIHEEGSELAEAKKNLVQRYRIITKEGDIRWVEDHKTSLFSENGDLLSIDGIVFDITERKQVEELLHQSEHKLRSTLDATPFPVAVVDLQDDKIFYWSSSALELFGHAASTATEWYKLAYPDPDYRQNAIARWNPFVEKARTSGKPVNTGEYRITCKDGTERICELYATFLPDNLIVTFNDITERKQAEEALIERTDFLDKIIEGAALSTWISDENGTAIRTNPACLELFGATEDEVIGKYNLFKDAVIINNGFISNIQEVFEKGKVANIVLDYDFGAVDHVNVKKATHKTVNSIFTPIKDAAGKVSNVIVQTIDLTDIKRLEKELLQSRKMESIGQLAGGIAHDFNNILASILGFSELALDDVEKGSTMEDDLQEIYAGGQRAKEIVKQMLAFARQSDEEVKPTRVDSIIIEALKLIRPSTPTTIEIRTEVESSSLVMGNTTQIHQIMMNLCTNAAHAMQENGGIMGVSLKDTFFDKNTRNMPKGLKSGKYLELVVSDTGCGIAPEHIDSIFDPYFTTKETGEGTGMGLAMVRGIIDSYGGTIMVESKPYIKTVFTIYLPVTSNLDNANTFGTDEPLAGGDESILFVDDEPSIAHMGRKILEHLGYTVTSRTSSVEALELFRAKPDSFALVITDMTMPHMTGDKFAMELKQIREDIRIILCTGYSNKISAEIAQGIGINAFAYKPLSKADLARTVREVLDKA